MLSIAYDLPEPLVDGNVERVLARLFGLPGAAGSPVLRKAAWSLAADRARTGRRCVESGADGARRGACSPRTHSRRLPPGSAVATRLAAGIRQRSRPQAAQEAGGPRARRGLDLARWGPLSVQRPADGPMAGLWELPTQRLTDGVGEHLWSTAWPGRLSPRLGGPAQEARHSITHHRIRSVFPAPGRSPGGQGVVHGGETPGSGSDGPYEKGLGAAPALSMGPGSVGIGRRPR
ncbi:MAG: hypothetical protein R3F17_08415 [Planctomycetota bacterium]